MSSEQSLPMPLEPKETYEIMQSNPRTVLIDIRSTMEFLMVGHPLGAIHVPWIDEPEWDTDVPRFVARVRELMLGGILCEEGECAPIILICRSGHRSLEAGKALLAAGFQNVCHVKDGFEGPLDEKHHRSTKCGWRFCNLPWVQC
jgi:rhodanese-related sulfurtransferase